MATGDTEIDAMQDILRLFESLNEAAQQRVAAWTYERFGPPLASSGLPSEVEVTPLGESVKEFIDVKAPKTASERLACLAYWAQRHGDRAVQVKTLDELNREAGGRTYSGATSMSTTAIEKGYLRRTKPGYLELTREGRKVVAAL